MRAWKWETRQLVFPGLIDMMREALFKEKRGREEKSYVKDGLDQRDRDDVEKVRVLGRCAGRSEQAAAGSP